MSMLSVILLLSATTSSLVQPGEQYAPGQVILVLTPDCRGRVELGMDGALATTGIPELDRVSAQWSVNRVAPLIRDPKPNPVAQRHGLDLMYTFYADPAADVAAMIDAYAACPRVQSAWPNLMRPLCEVPNDPRYGQQWHLIKIQGAEAWDVTHGDTMVLIGVVDDGADYWHPDIVSNLWINREEDINFSGEFEPWDAASGGDIDGNDQDANGFYDDVIGYDFVNDDPDPMPVGADDHGTHCWGTTNAVTNNGTGIASVAWGCRGMALKAGQGGFVYMNAAVQAIYYSIDKGVWVTSHSYGSQSPHGPEQSAMEYAWDMGGVVLAAAGNAGVQDPHYPGAYEICIGVAATNNQDQRTSWSNYGTWVECGSPGENILSTVPDSNYAGMSGTSMATPLAAGLCALMKASDPGMINQTCRDRLIATCDSMPDPDYRAGLMGGGRINAFKAVSAGSRCYLGLGGVHISSPDGDTILEPNEMAGITVTLTNPIGWQDASNIQATLTCRDPDITIVKGTATFPNIPAGSSANCAADSFVIQVNGNPVPQRALFTVTATASPNNQAPGQPFRLLVGTPHILIVNDFASRSYTQWYRYACDSLGVLYDQFHVDSSGAPSSDTLRHYPVVIWATGLDSTNLLSTACQNALQAYMDNGGRLFICGQNIAQARTGTAFLNNYLKAELDTYNTAKFFIKGLVGDEISRGDSLACAGAGGAANARSCDGIRPMNGSFGCFIYKDFPDTTVYSAIHYAGGYKLVYFAMPFEAIDHAQLRYTQKPEILRRILNFFGEPLPNAVSEPLAGPALRFRAGLAVRPSIATDRAEIEYTLRRGASADIRVYNPDGRLVATLNAGSTVPGTQRATWNLRDDQGRRVAPGVYFCTVNDGAESLTGKLLIAR